jgi:hypothetical protein
LDSSAVSKQAPSIHRKGKCNVGRFEGDERLVVGEKNYVIFGNIEAIDSVG